MRRILFVSVTGELGGAERSLAELVLALDRSRFEPHAVTPGPGPLASRLGRAGVGVDFARVERIRRTVNPIRIARYVAAISKASRAVADLARSKRVDVIHANTDVAQVYAGEAAARAGVTSIWHSRDMLGLGPLGERLSEKAACVIAISEAVAAHLADSGVDSSKIRVVENGIALGFFKELDLDNARSSARQELGLAEGAFVAGTAGAFVPWKRHEDFVRAFGRLSEMEVADHVESPEGPGSERVEVARIVPARGVVFGADILGENERYERDLKRLADEFTGERVLFPGWREDLARLLPALDVFVSPSEDEPFGRVIVEAMAAGVPVIATDSGGKPEIVEHGETGVLVPQGDVEAMAEALYKLRHDEEMRKSLARAARRAAFERFSVERVAREVEQVYEEVLGDRA